ncbi:MAG: uridine kinase [Coriobacteriia bacterium]|jgi:molybdenum storage protein|nr:uridine kinase [Coriobacteriia bacterium]
MPLMRDRDGKRLHVKSKLMGESLVSESFLGSLEQVPQRRMFPDVNVMKIGGQSICDRGKRALPQLAEEIVANKSAHKMLLLTGGGTRSRHIYSIGLELGMPTGVIAAFGSSVSRQNALLLATLLAPEGGIEIDQDAIVKLPNYFAQGCIPVTHGMPPYDFFAIPQRDSRIPIHRTDVGTMLMADLIGARSCIFVKDERGLYTDDPKKDPSAEFIAEITVSELIERGLDDMIIERPCLDILSNSEVLDHVQIVNGLERGALTGALAGEHTGTIIRQG